MTIKELFDYVDEVKPNAYSNKVKTVWLNQAEGKVMTEVFLWNEAEVFEYHYEYSGSASVYFPDEHTLAFTDTTLLKNFRPGGQITKLTAPAP